jgi:hypothetical protein
MVEAARPAAMERRRNVRRWAERRPEHLISGAAVGCLIHERMYETDHWEARAGSAVGDGGAAAIGVPSQNLPRETYAAHGIHTGSEGDARRRHMRDVCAAGGVEHVEPLQKARKRLTVRAVAEEAEAFRRRNHARNASHAAAAAAQREVQGRERHANRSTPLSQRVLA